MNVHLLQPRVAPQNAGENTCIYRLLWAVTHTLVVACLLEYQFAVHEGWAEKALQLSLDGRRLRLSVGASCFC